MKICRLDKLLSLGGLYRTDCEVQKKVKLAIPTAWTWCDARGPTLTFRRRQISIM
jgi:hypothetical protein